MGSVRPVSQNPFTREITMNVLRKLKLAQRFALLVGVFVVGFILTEFGSFRTLNELKVNGPVYEHIVQGKDLAGDAEPPPVYILESYLVVTLQLARAGAMPSRAKLIEHLKSLKKRLRHTTPTIGARLASTPDLNNRAGQAGA